MSRRDPPVRRDGACAVCRAPRRPERSRRYGQGAAELDPFCSTACARAFHRCPLPEQKTVSAELEPDRCSRCGCDLREQTPGCTACRKRANARRRAEAARA